MLCVVLLCGCGGTSASDACSEVCSLPDSCFAEFDLPNPGDDCLDACRSAIDEVGVGCVLSIVDAIDCLGTCDVDSLTSEDFLECQDQLEGIVPACDQ